jgi:hypothetical protein
MSKPAACDSVDVLVVLSKNATMGFSVSSLSLSLIFLCDLDDPHARGEEDIGGLISAHGKGVNDVQ